MEKFKNYLTIKRIIGLVILIFILIFAFQNMSVVQISFVLFAIKLPLLVLIMVLFGLGALFGVIMSKKNR